MQAHPHADFREALFAQLFVDAKHPSLHSHCCAECVSRVLRCRRRRAEQGHQSVAQVFIERAAVREDDIGHGRKVLVQQVHDLFRRRVLGNSCEAAYVCEEHGNGLHYTEGFGACPADS